MQQSTLQAIQAHAVAAYPRECCGLIVATAGGEAYVACRNVAATPNEHFILPAEDYAAAEDQGEVVALVHSHPNASATPSDADRVICEQSGLTWHIVSVGQVTGEAPSVVTCSPSAPAAMLRRL